MAEWAITHPYLTFVLLLILVIGVADGVTEYGRGHGGRRVKKEEEDAD